MNPTFCIIDISLKLTNRIIVFQISTSLKLGVCYSMVFEKIELLLLQIFVKIGEIIPS
jgi:hypothetical protein